jgi:hypothetical protein
MTKLLNHPLLAILLLLLLIACSFLALNVAFRPTMNRVDWQEDTYKVKSGDSLWEIAGEYCPDKVDRREWIEEVKTLNGMGDSMIHPGQKLTILVPEED